MTRFATRLRVLRGSLAMTAIASTGLAAFASAPLGAPVATVAPGDASEYEVKAAFLYNFGRFMTWPDDAFTGADAPFVVGVVGGDPFGTTLDAMLKGKRIGTHPIVVERYASAEKIGRPHLLFAGGRDEDKLAATRIACRDRPIALIGECPGFCADGGMANFFLEEGKVRFEINPGAAKRARLSISSQLLKLARIVEGP